MAGLAWSAKTESGGSPQTYYEYRAFYSDRRKNKIHIKLQLRVRMASSTNYYSFGLSHSCKVNGKLIRKTLKSNRKWWGGKRPSSSDWGYGFEGSSDGTAWHGWYTVFDNDVTVDIDDTSVEIIPCIHRNPVCGPGLSYPSNDLDKTNWKGRKGCWVPWGDTLYKGSWAKRALTIDAAFLNNKSYKPLSGGFSIPKYPRPDRPTKVTLSPSSMDVRYQDSKTLKASWNKCERAVGYKIWLYMVGGEKVYLGKTTKTSLSFNPKKYLSKLKPGRKEIVDGDKFYVEVQSYDKNSVKSKYTRKSGKTNYFEVKTYAPTSCSLTGRKGIANQILYRGENVTVRYGGEVNGSWPITSYSLVRLSDGATVSWSPTQANEKVSPHTILRAITAVQRPNTVHTYELRAYNKNGAVKMKNGAWFRFNVNFYGGLIYVYDKPLGRWHEGIAWIYCNGRWHESEAVHVRTKAGWKTL